MFSFLKNPPPLHRSTAPPFLIFLSPKRPHTHRTLSLPSSRTHTAQITLPESLSLSRSVSTNRSNPSLRETLTLSLSLSLSVSTNSSRQLFLLSLLNPRTPPHSQFHNLTYTFPQCRRSPPLLPPLILTCHFLVHSLTH